jgi:cysteine desulfurase
MRVYFDYNATTPLAPEVVDTISQVSRNLFGNPSSIHHFGQQAKATIDDARSATASLINADPSEIVFVSGGTEADNFAIRGAAEALEATGRRHLIASGIEHEAVLNTLRALARRGWRTTLLPVDQTGVVSPDRLREAIDADTAMVSVMHANNEIGTIQPVAALAAIAHEHGALMHTDAVQTAGKVPVDVRALGVDLLSLSAHKFNGPKGAGALWIKRGTRMQPTATGGKHERNRRAGTENVAAIAGLGVAAVLAAQGWRRGCSRAPSGWLSQRPRTSRRTLVNGTRCPGPRAPRTSASSVSRPRATRSLSRASKGSTSPTGSARSSGTPRAFACSRPWACPPTRELLRFSLGMFSTRREDHVA